MLIVEDLHVAVGTTQVLKGLNLTVPTGEVHAIMGPNGSGKSTLSYVLAQTGVSLPVCLGILTLAPLIVVIGHEQTKGSGPLLL